MFNFVMLHKQGVVPTFCTNSDGDETGQEKSDLKERAGSRRPNRFQPYSKDKVGDKKGSHRNRVFISNIPYDMKWQAIKDLMRQKVGEVTYVELFKDAEGKSRFKDEEFVKKAIEVMNRYDLNGRPLNIKEDPDGEHARRMLQRAVGMYPGGCGPEGLRSGMNFPPSIINNPNVPPEIIHSLQAGRLGSTVFVANLDFKVGWKKLKEVFSMAGVVKRADVKEEKNGKSRGMGTVTFEEAFEAVQADDKSLPLDDFHSVEKTPQLPRGLGGVGMGLGPGGQPISTSQLSSGGAMGSMGRGGMDGPGYGGMNRMGGMSGGGFNSMDGMGGFGGRDMAMGRMGDMYPSGMGSMNRDFGRNDMPMNRGYGDSFGGMGGMGNYGGGMGSTSGGPMGSGMGGVMGNMGMDRMGSNFDRVGMDANRGFGGFGGGSGQMGGGNLDRGSRSKVGCQIFVRNLPYDLTWQKLKEKFSHCGQVMFAEIKMENGRSKGCGTVRFDSPESAEQACRLMNGIKINGREVDVRLDRNA
ncbi:myelin expression factor 2-like [Scleropages formosus]|uniref:Myelin expression factor 2-like n=1 Tax=Scleropages formosus TaxID=113540 RepID=A0A0P7TY89_SCLFO|nr:myelin expression factor 2-like [Scleropages formosus]